MTKDEARAILPLFHNLEGYRSLHVYVQSRMDTIKKQLLNANSWEEVVGLQKAHFELEKILSLREKAQRVLEENDG